MPPNVPNHSDIEGLNLNITVPKGKNGEIDINAKLPVHVFVHGGGFAVGSSWYPQYDQAPFVRMSIEKGKPIISVTIKLVNHPLHTIMVTNCSQLPLRCDWFHDFEGTSKRRLQSEQWFP